MTEGEFRKIAANRSFKAAMRRALRLVLVHGYRQASAAKATGTRRQHVHEALMSVYAQHPDHIPQ